MWNSRLEERNDKYKFDNQLLKIISYIYIYDIINIKNKEGIVI